MNWTERIKNYEQVTGFPKSLFIAGDGRVVGTLIMGNDFRGGSALYGSYPAGYLKRMKSLFPDKKHVLHLFSGNVDTKLFLAKHAIWMLRTGQITWMMLKR